ncbi:MAG: alpha/beta hydrolase [Anaerolineae bacterium]
MDHYTLSHKECTLHYWLTGPQNRPMLIFTHGATADHLMFEPQIAEFAKDYRILVHDVRGHGESRPLNVPFSLEDCADDLLAMLDALEVKDAVMIGQSMGGLIAQRLYLKAPARVQAMVIIGSVCIAIPYSKIEVWVLKVTVPLFNFVPYGSFKRLVSNSVGVTPETRTYMARTLEKLSHKEFLQIWKGVSLAVDTRGLPNHHIRVPLLLTHGDQDNTGTIRRDAPRWAAYDPDVRYVVIPNASHNANQDNPAFFNQKLRDFLTERVG